MEFIYSCLSCFLLFLLLPSNFAFIILYSFLKKNKLSRLYKCHAPQNIGQCLYIYSWEEKEGKWVQTAHPTLG